MNQLNDMLKYMKNKGYFYKKCGSVNSPGYTWEDKGSTWSLEERGREVF